MNLADIPIEVSDTARKIAANEGEQLIGYRALTEDDPSQYGMVRVRAWQIVTDTGVYEIWPDGICYRSSVLHPLDQLTPAELRMAAEIANQETPC